MTLDDVDAHIAGEDDETVRFFSGGRSTVETTSAWIARNLDSWATSGPIRCFAICEAATGSLCGTVEANLDLAGTRRGVTNISYGLHPHVRSRGYASRAVRLVLDYLLAHTDTDTAIIQVSSDNAPSLRIPPRLGFRHVGRRVTAQNECLDTFVLALKQAAPSGGDDAD